MEMNMYEAIKGRTTYTAINLSDKRLKENVEKEIIDNEKQNFSKKVTLDDSNKH